MGATLPILTKFFNTYIQNIGSTIGELYFYNTLGAAIGALSTGFVFFHYLTLSQTIYIASILNLLISFFIYIFYGKVQHEK